MFEVINQAWLLTITSPTTACSPTVKARKFIQPHLLLVLSGISYCCCIFWPNASRDARWNAHLIARRLQCVSTGLDQPQTWLSKRCQLRFPHSNDECHRDHKQNRQLKLNGVLKPNAAGFHVDRLCLTSPFPCIWWLATTREHLTTTYRNSVHRRKSINALSGIYAFISRSERFVMFHLWMILEPLFIQLNCLYFYRWIQHTVD